ncbi:hypothetical protein [Tepidanaerobacter acetatoxydans]|nr:hypothetical protein [Tepidanaerobacter acetatoxydans]
MMAAVENVPEGTEVMIEHVHTEEGKHWPQQVERAADGCWKYLQYSTGKC